MATWTVLVPFVYAIMVTLEQEVLGRQTSRAKHLLRQRVADAKRQQRVIMKAVLDQVPPFS